MAPDYVIRVGGEFFAERHTLHDAVVLSQELTGGGSERVERNGSLYDQPKDTTRFDLTTGTGTTPSGQTVEILGKASLGEELDEGRVTNIRLEGTTYIADEGPGVIHVPEAAWQRPGEGWD